MSTSIDDITVITTDLTVALDQTYVVVMGSIVFLMQAGFAALEIGSSRLQNSASILLKNFSDICYSALAFFLTGYAVAFSSNSSFTNTFMGIGSYNTGSSENDFAFLFFQIAFASTAATIVSGAMLERTRNITYSIWTMVLVGFIYPVVVHWVWSDTGFMSAANGSPIFGKPLIDFAGAGVVHMVGGVSAIIGAYFVGQRDGFLTPFDKKTPNGHNLRGHSIQLSGLGALILWFGFYGFNCGSTLGVSGGKHEQMALIAVTTTMSAVCAGVCSHSLTMARPQRYGLTDILNCVLTALVAVTASCNSITPWISCVVGIISVPVYFLSDHLIRQKAAIDDALSAGAVHAGGGLWGLVSAGLFSHTSDGTVSSLFYGDGHQFGVQLLGALLIILWTGSLSITAFFCLDRFVGLRVSKKTENMGLDNEIGVQQNGELQRMKAAVLQSNGLESLLANAKDPLLLQFREFLRREYAGENLDFLIDVTLYRQYHHELMHSRVPLTEEKRAAREALLWKKAQEIVNRYLKHTSSHEVNVSSAVRTEMNSLIEKACSDDEHVRLSAPPVILALNTLSRGYFETLTMLKDDAWRRFLGDVHSEHLKIVPSALLQSLNSSKGISFNAPTMTLATSNCTFGGVMHFKDNEDTNEI